MYVAGAEVNAHLLVGNQLPLKKGTDMKKKKKKERGEKRKKKKKKKFIPLTLSTSSEVNGIEWHPGAMRGGGRGGEKKKKKKLNLLATSYRAFSGAYHGKERKGEGKLVRMRLRSCDAPPYV